MKISFSTPIDWNDGSAIASADLATATYTLFVDTVNPPIKSYSVPAANLAAATTNADGSKQVTVDAAKDLGIAVAPNRPYYIAAQDSVDSIVSPETTILTYQNVVQPKEPGNFSVA